MSIIMFLLSIIHNLPTIRTVAGDSDSFLIIELPYLVSRGQYWLILDGTAAYIPLYIEKVEKWSGVTDP